MNDGHLLHSVERPAGFIAKGPSYPKLLELNFGQLLEQQCETRPEKVAFKSRWQNQSLTFQALYDSSRHVARTLLARNVRPGDHVVVLTGNTIEYLQLFFAVAGIGAVFTIINPTFTSEEVLSTIDFIEPKATFIARRIGYRSNESTLKKLAQNRAQSLLVQFGDETSVSDDFISWADLLHTAGSETLLDTYWAKGLVHDTVCIQFTSGTTGPRKAAMLTHHNFINNAYLVGLRLGLRVDDILCCSPPLFHCFGLVAGPLMTVVHGATAIIPSDVFRADSSLEVCIHDGCTVINAVATMFVAMLDHAKTLRPPPTLKLRTGIIAGSALAEVLLHRLRDEFAFTGLAYAFGMTELSCIAFMTDPSKVSLLHERTFVGTPLPHTAAKIVDENAKTLAAGSIGELLISGYCVFKEYHKNPTKTNEAFVKGSDEKLWLGTGDVCTLTGSGEGMVVGRVKDMIKKGGENIAPADIEQMLTEHDQITDAAVVGIPDARLGELVVAYMQRMPGRVDQVGSLTSKGIKIWLRKRMAAHKVPDHFFWLAEDAGAPQEVPYNASGKILKTELRANAMSLLGVR